MPVNQQPNSVAKDLVMQLIQHAFRILERFYNGEDIAKDPNASVMILNSTCYRSAVVSNPNEQ